MSEVISIRLPRSTYFLLQTYAEIRNVSVSDIVRDAINYYIHNIISQGITTPELKIRYVLHKVNELERYIKEIRYLHSAFTKAQAWIEDIQHNTYKYTEKGYHPHELDLIIRLEKEIKKVIIEAQKEIVSMMKEVYEKEVDNE